MSKLRSRYSFHGGVASIAGAQPINNNTRDVAPQTVWVVDTSLMENFHTPTQEVEQGDIAPVAAEPLEEVVDLKEELNNESNNELHGLSLKQDGQISEVKGSRKQEISSISNKKL